MNLGELVYPERIGILRGHYSHGGNVDIIAAGNSALPARGDFAVMPDAGRTRMLVLRVNGANTLGTFGENNDRGIEYLSQLTKMGETDAVPDRVRELTLRFRVQATPLGWLTWTDDAWRFESGWRDLDVFGHWVYRPNNTLLELLVNAGLELTADHF